MGKWGRNGKGGDKKVGRHATKAEVAKEKGKTAPTKRPAPPPDANRSERREFARKAGVWCGHARVTSRR